MTPISIDASSPRTADLRVIGLVGSAHFVSHIYILVLPPVFPFVRAEFGVSYTELGFVVAVFNIVSGAAADAGRLSGRPDIGARLVLVGGLLLGAASLVAAASAPGFLLLGVAFAFLGLANTVYHPADYALLSNRVSPGRVGQAFSIHIFAGFIGTAITPAAMVVLAQHARLARRVPGRGRSRCRGGGRHPRLRRAAWRARGGARQGCGCNGAIGRRLARARNLAGHCSIWCSSC